MKLDMATLTFRCLSHGKKFTNQSPIECMDHLRLKFTVVSMLHGVGDDRGSELEMPNSRDYAVSVIDSGLQKKVT